MLMGHFRRWSAFALVCASGLNLTSCSPAPTKGIIRIHLGNEGDTALSFLAIDTSEAALATAANRLAKPLPPHAVYSAVLSRSGNYWVRAEVETDGYTVERIEGPVRVGRGVATLPLKQVDARPLYLSSVPYSPAGRISFSSN
ncbi:MAG: hypothetical protein Q8N51_08155 [Gammaproteobacteria bacterium]|nr:hypothetical protein [Gammaproteobacteria bacterium]